MFRHINSAHGHRQSTGCQQSCPQRVPAGASTYGVARLRQPRLWRRDRLQASSHGHQNTDAPLAVMVNSCTVSDTGGRRMALKATISTAALPLRYLASARWPALYFPYTWPGSAAATLIAQVQVWLCPPLRHRPVDSTWAGFARLPYLVSIFSSCIACIAMHGLRAGM